MIPARLRKFIDREYVQIEPVNDMYRAQVMVDDRPLFTGTLWIDISDAATEAEDAFISLLDERAEKARAEREDERDEWAKGVA